MKSLRKLWNRPYGRIILTTLLVIFVLWNLIDVVGVYPNQAEHERAMRLSLERATKRMEDEIRREKTSPSK